MADEENKKEVKLKEIVKDFTKETTFHGLKYIAEESRFVSRRISWVIVIITVITVFTYAIIDRLLHFYTYPSNIALEVSYKPSVPFPAVTFCNQNPYRLTALQHHGMYDMITQALATESDSKKGACQENYMLNTVVCHVPDNAAYIEKINETTAYVCKQLCTLHAPYNCSAILYEAPSRTCTLTSYSGEDKVWFTKEEQTSARNMCRRKKSYFFRRIRCLDKDSILCTFEEGNGVNFTTPSCRFRSDVSQSEEWIRVEAAYPDVTLQSTVGHYIYMLETNTRGGNSAILQTDYLNTTNKCIFLFVAIFGYEDGRFSVILEDEQLNRIVLRQLEKFSVLKEVTSSLHTDSSIQWIRIFKRLPPGAHRIIIEATRGRHDIYSGFAIDNIEVTKCHHLFRNCINSIGGLEYMGNQTNNIYGECLPWTRVRDIYQINSIQAIPTTIFLPDTTWKDASNYCRYFAGMTANKEHLIGCFHQIDQDNTLHWGHCNINRCECQNDQFQCGTMFCIPRSKLCDRAFNCEDQKDEGSVCDSNRTLPCNFESSFLCGYKATNNIASLKWAVDSNDLPSQNHILQWIPNPVITAGEIAVIKTPTMAFSSNTRISIWVKIKTSNLVLRSHITLWLFGTLGMSIQPIISLEVKYIPSADNTGQWSKYDVCIPGGHGIQHGIITTGPFYAGMEIHLDNVIILDHSCSNPNIGFPSKESINCDFKANICGYKTLSDHQGLIWTSLPKDNLQKTSLIDAKLYTESTECINCFKYDDGLHYSKVYLTTSGYILSPRFPKNYPNKRFQRWIIDMPPGYTVNITFSVFRVQASINCQSDFLEIKEHLQNGTVYKLCGELGTNISSHYAMPSSTVKLLFWTDHAITDAGFSMTYIAVPPASYEIAIGLWYLGKPSTQLYQSKLISPVLDPSSDHCISFEYDKLDYIALNFILLNGSSSFLFKDITSYKNPAWAKMMVNINNRGQVGSYLQFEGKKPPNAISMTYLAFISNVQIFDGLCKDVSVPGNISCDFEDINQCGYFDGSKSINKWRRTFVDSNVMAYAVNSTLNTQTQGELVSQMISISNSSCLELRLLYSSTACLRVLIKNQQNELIQNVSLKCLFTKVMTATLMYVDVPVGIYRLTFTVNSPITTQIYIDDINVLHQECNQPSALYSDTVNETFTPSALLTENSTAPLTIVLDTTSIPLTSSTTNIVTSSLTEYESTTTTPTMNRTDTHISQLYVDGLIALELMMLSLNQGLEHFWEIMAQKQENLLIQCSWNGVQCNSSFLSHTVTDMGKCFSINKNPVQGQFLESQREGSVFGLSLTLNIEDYEHVAGIGTDSGIKIYFYDPNKIPIMKAEGYAVAPGTHSLFSLQYIESTFLKPKYGTCDKVGLLLYPKVNYTTSHCVTECLTVNMMKSCNCIFPYMPDVGQNSSNICTVRDYFHCAISFERSTKKLGCNCPDACKDTTYGIELSSTKLSGLSFKTILDDKEDTAFQNFHDGLDLQYRIRDNIVVPFLTLLKILPELINDLLNYVSVQTMQLGILVEKAMMTIKTITISDASLTLTAFSNSKSFYKTFIHPERHNLATRFTEFQKSVDDLVYLVKWNYNPCVQYDTASLRDISDLRSGLSKIISDHKILDDLLMGYVSIYTCSLYNDDKVKAASCDFDPRDFSVFPNYTMLGLPWALNSELPEKTVLTGEANTFCKEFITDIWQNIYSQKSFKDLYKVITSLTAFNKTSSCNYYLEFLNNPPYLINDAKYNQDPFILLKGYHKTQDIFDYQTTVTFLQQLSANFITISDKLNGCLLEYGQFLDESEQKTAKNVKYLEDTNVTVNVITEQNVIDLKYFYNKFQNMYESYKKDTVSKLALANVMLSQGYTYDNLQHLTDWLTYLKSYYSQKVITDNMPLINGFENTLITTYTNIIEDFISLSEYLGSSNISGEIRNFSIFRMPVPKVQSAKTTFLLSEEQTKAKFGKDLTEYITDNGVIDITTALAAYFDELRTSLHGKYSKYLSKEASILAVVSELKEMLKELRSTLTMGSDFIRDNVMQVDIYFGELKSTSTTQSIGYSMMDFFSDLGGYLGLLLGASVITVCEVLDLIIYNILTLKLNKEKKTEKLQQEQTQKVKSKSSFGGWFSPLRGKQRTKSSGQVEPFDDYKDISGENAL